MTTQSKLHAARIKARRVALGISFEGFYDALGGITLREAEWVENGQYGKNVTEFRAKVDQYLELLEKKKGTYKALRFIQPQQEGTKLGRKLVMPAARFLIVTEDGRTVTKAGEDIRHRRMGLGVQHHQIPGLTPNQVDNVEVGLYHEQWVNFANKIWTFLDGIEEQNQALFGELGEQNLLPFPPYLDPQVSVDRANEAPELFPTQEQCAEFADNLGQWMLKHDRDIITIPWSDFYEMLFEQTGANRLNISMMEISFAENVIDGVVPFLFSCGENVVVVCKDSIFAPVDLPE